MSDEREGVNAAYARYGLPPALTDRPAIIAALEEEIRREATEDGDHYLMRLLCAQLFSLGVVEDSLLIWRAKACNGDTMFGIDVRLLCGAGLDRTKAFLAGVGTAAAAEALEYIRKCQDEGIFKQFEVAAALAEYRHFNWGK
jgi:hypothetical protein